MMKEKPLILVVDDDISMCKSMALILEYNGCVVTTAEDGFQAIERVKERPFDIAFMDIKMPGINGVDAYRKIKEIRPDTVAVMMTGYSVGDLIEEALQEGAYAVLDKPLDMGKVLEIVNEITKGKQVGEV